MPHKKGFTLIEIIIIMIIVGILAAMALPSYLNYVQQGAARAAQSNLITIYNAQKNYYLSNGIYCTTSCNNLTNINTTLSVTITDSNFTYVCASDASGFQCTARNLIDTNLYLTLKNNSLVVPGGTGCTASPWLAPCNPSCATDNSNFCPN